MDKTHVTTAIWKTTKYKLRLLAAQRGQTIVETLHELVSEALAEEQDKQSNQ